MLSTMPSSSSFRASSWQSQSDRDLPSRSGISHAIFTRWSATSGGKSGLSPTARFVLEPLNSLAIESTNPKSNDPATHSNHAAGFREALALRDEQDRSRSSHQSGSHFGGTYPAVEFIALVFCQVNNIGRFASTHVDFLQAVGSSLDYNRCAEMSTKFGYPNSNTLFWGPVLSTGPHKKVSIKLPPLGAQHRP
jgi:hypothetical protein